MDRFGLFFIRLVMITVGYATDGVNPWDIEAADLNGDTYADLIVANFSSHNIKLLFNNGVSASGRGISVGQGQRERN